MVLKKLGWRSLRGGREIKINTETETRVKHSDRKAAEEKERSADMGMREDDGRWEETMQQGQKKGIHRG